LHLLVARLLVMELEAVKTIEDVHFAQVRSYLRATGRKHGLLLSFAKPALSVERVIASLPSHQDLLVSRLP
jgi:GxxExxY protein